MAISVITALGIVPAKIGTQEAGKTAIFAGLGLPASKGLAFGLVRHVRELAWAAAGFAVYAWDRRRRASRPAPDGCPLPEGSAARGD